ncbi:hypothetical protein [Bacillus phage vB_BanS-Thrax1]|nr:hypothetical protein [Bacillus phage vB_BanS-Thrax1]
MNLWDRIKDTFKSADSAKIILEKKETELIDVEFSGIYYYKIKPDPSRDYNWYPDHAVFAKFDARLEAKIGSYDLSQNVYYYIKILSAGDKHKAFRKFMEMSDNKKEEIILKELKRDVIRTLKYEYEKLDKNNIDEVFAELEPKNIRITMKVKKDKITKK